MKKLYLFIFSLFPLLSFSQGLINNGGYLTVQSGSYITISGVGGNYINQTNGVNNGQVNLDGTIDVKGNWINNADAGNYVFSGAANNDGTVIFSGPAAQTIGGTETSNFENLTINNSNALTLNFSTANTKDIRVNGNLNFLLGKIVTQTNFLTLSSSSHVFGAAATNYVFGNVKKEYSNNAQTDNPFTFPLGTIGGSNAGYSPAIINFTSAKPSSGSLTINANPNKDIHADPVYSLNRYWTLSNNSLVFTGNYDATYTYLAGDFVAPFTESTYEPMMLWGNWTSSWAYPAISNRNSVGSGGSISVTALNTFGENTGIMNVPQITTQPVGGTQCIGTLYSLSVIANGSSELNYQWYKNSIIISGATNNLYQIPSLNITDAAEYYCVITNIFASVPLNSATSNKVTLIVNTPPTVLTSPSSIAQCAGNNITFNSSVTGSLPIVYSWYKNSVQIGNNNSQLTINNIIANDAGNYVCVVENSCGRVTSNSSTLTVHSPPSVTSQPLSVSQCLGNTAAFNITAIGTGTLNYQWYKNNDQLTINNEQLFLNNIIETDAGNYTCVVTNICGSVTSSSAVLTVNTPPVLISKTADAIKCTRDSVMFKLNINANPLPSFQWIKDGVDIAGATKSSYFISVVISENAGLYSCNISNVCGNISAAITLAVNNSPFIQDTIPNQSACEGSNISFSFHATGTNLSYQWADNGGAISGATSSIYSINNLKVSDGNIYTCSVSNSCDVKTLKAFVLNILQKPVISITPLIQTKYPGDSLTYVLSPTGTPPYFYQWKKDNVVLSGKTMNPFQIKPIECSDAGVYSIVISNVCGSISTEAGTLLVNCGGYTLNGYVRYDDKTQKPMSNTTVYLENSSSVRVASAETDGTGFYQFANVTTDVYKLVCETTYKWGGGNPTDALLINKYFVALYTFGDELKKKAADVNADGKINPTDALNINRRFVALITKFTAPDWIFETPTVIVVNNNLQQDIKAICTGDVDGSY